MYQGDANEQSEAGGKAVDTGYHPEELDELRELYSQLSESHRRAVREVLNGR